MARTVDFIKRVTKAGWKKRLAILNEVISKLNPLLDIRVEERPEESRIIYSSSVIKLTIQSYQAQIDALEARITQNETDIADHESRITTLEGP